LQQEPVKFDNPLDTYARVQQISGIQNQNRLAQLQYDQAARQDTQQNALAQAYRDAYDPQTGQLDNSKLIGNLAGAGAGAVIPGVQKGAAEAQKAQREADKANLEQAIQKQALVSQYAGSATDQASWDAARNAVSQLGIDISQVPQQFDPSVAKQLQQRALTGVQQLDQHWKQKGYDLDVRKQEEIERNNKAQNTVAQGQLGVAKQRLAYDQSQPKGQFDSDRGILVDPRTGNATPVRDASGNPIGSKQSNTQPSEDERRSAGLAVRMESALKLVNDVTKENPSAAKPRFLERAAGKVSEDAANSVRGTARQRVDTAQIDALDAALTLATGAAYTKEQLAGLSKSYFPQIGDDQQTVQDKKNRLQEVIQTARIRAGRAEGNIDRVRGNSPQQATSVPADIAELLKKHGG